MIMKDNDRFLSQEDKKSLTKRQNFVRFFNQL